MNLNELKKKLKEISKEDLIKDISDLYKKNGFVKDYFEFKFSDESNLSILIKHKEIIEKEFFPKKGFAKVRLSTAKKAITEFKKISKDRKQICELMVFYVEMGVKHTNMYGDIDEQFYMSIEGMFEQSVKYIKKHDLSELFKGRCLKIVDDTNGLGWGFHDHLRVVYYDNFRPLKSLKSLL